MLGPCRRRAGSSRVAESRGRSLVGSAWASHSGGSSCCGARAQALWLLGSRAQTGVRGAWHVGVFPGQGSSPCLLRWLEGFSALSNQGSPISVCASPKATHCPRPALWGAMPTAPPGAPRRWALTGTRPAVCGVHLDDTGVKIPQGWY